MGVLDSQECNMALCRSLRYGSSAALHFKLRDSEFETEGKYGLFLRVCVSNISLRRFM